MARARASGCTTTSRASPPAQSEYDGDPLFALDAPAEYSAGETVTVTLHALGATPFRGFVVSAHLADTLEQRASTTEIKPAQGEGLFAEVRRRRAAAAPPPPRGPLD